MAGKPNDKISDEVRTYVVTALAMWDTPSIVAAAVKKEFAITVTRQAIEAYNPTKKAGEHLAQKWVDLFNATRKKHTEDASEVATTHRLNRVRRLERMADRAEERGNDVLAAQHLEQIAKEMGDAFTNRRKLDGALVVSTPKSLADFYGGES